MRTDSRDLMCENLKKLINNKNLKKKQLYHKSKEFIHGQRKLSKEKINQEFY